MVVIPTDSNQNIPQAPTSTPTGSHSIIAIIIPILVIAIIGIVAYIIYSRRHTKKDVVVESIAETDTINLDHLPYHHSIPPPAYFATTRTRTRDSEEAVGTRSSSFEKDSSISPG